jgi:hypothetical protein
MEYNKVGNRGARVGNWVEESALESQTGIYRSESWTSLDRDVPPITLKSGVGKLTDTNIRTIAHTSKQDYRQLESSTQAAHSRYSSSYSKSNLSAKGPRSTLRDEELLNRAREQLANECRMSLPTTDNINSESRTEYKRWRSPVSSGLGRRVMKNQDAEDIPAEALIERSQFLSERGILKRAQPRINSAY